MNTLPGLAFMGRCVRPDLSAGPGNPKNESDACFPLSKLQESQWKRLHLRPSAKVRVQKSILPGSYGA